VYFQSQSGTDLSQ